MCSKDAEDADIRHDDNEKARAPVTAEIDALRRPQTCGWIAINRPDSAKACSAAVARRAASFTGKALMYKEMLTLVDPRPTAVEKNPIAATAYARPAARS